MAFDLGLGTGHLVALEFSGQFCSSEVSKTIKGATFVGRSLAETTGEGWRGLRGACSADKTKTHRHKLQQYNLKEKKKKPKDTQTV